MTIPEIPGYNELTQVGHGASSIVYRAEDTSHARQVAIKVLNKKRMSEADRLALERELSAMGQLSGHPHIVDLIGSGFCDDGRPYIIMPFYQHGTFGALVEEQGPMTWQDVVDFGVKIASALETAHQRGVVHRDIKPANIYRGDFGGQPLLADFGVSSFVAPSMEGSQTVTISTTPLFAAPEVLNGIRPTVLSDIYSLGTTLFGLVEGRAAYADASVQAVVKSVTSPEPVPLIGEQAPQELRQLVARMMAKRPIRRPASALEVARMLNDIQRQHGLSVTEPLVASNDQSSGVADMSAAVPVDASNGQPLDSQQRESRPLDTVGSKDTQSVSSLDRPTEPVKAELAPNVGVRHVTKARPGRMAAVAVGLVSFAAIAGYALLSGSDPFEPAAGPASSFEVAGLEQQQWAGSPQRTVSFQAHDGVLETLEWSTDGQQLATGGRDETIRIWEPDNVDRPIHALAVRGWVLDLDWSSTGMIGASDTIGVLTMWNPGGDDPVAISAHDGVAESVGWSADGARIASGGDDSVIKIWAADGSAERTLTGHDGSVLSLSWSAEDPQALASGSTDGTARVWDGGTGAAGVVVDGHEDWVRSAAWSPQSAALATSGADQTLRVWDGRTGDELRTFPLDSDPVGAAVWSPRGSLLASGEENGTVRVWDVAGDAELAAFAESSSAVVSLAWSPDGERLAVGRTDGSVEIWQPEPGDS